jgi:hypothetical protein
MTKPIAYALIAACLVTSCRSGGPTGPGEIVAEAELDPGIAPFKVVVRRVSVPVTNSDHFIVDLSRGRLVVASNRFFWPGYTPKKVEIAWPCMERFTVRFDGEHTATCEWSWGRGATWKVEDKGSEKAGLSPYFFTPRNAVPPGCSIDQTGISAG